MNSIWIVKELTAPNSDRQCVFSSKEQAKKAIRKWIDTVFYTFKNNKVKAREIEEEDKTIYEFSWLDDSNKEKGFCVAIVKIPINNILPSNWNEHYKNEPCHIDKPGYFKY